MPNIAIIDDNREQRETLKKALQVYLKQQGSTLEVIDMFPLKEYKDYFPWIEKSDISVLIFDERLHDQSDNGKGPVGYRGNQLVTEIRKQFKDIPIFTVTSHTEDPELQAKFGEFDHIIGRQDFIDDGLKYVSIIIRSSQRYLDENQNELREFGELTKFAASGHATPDNLSRLKALQVKLNIPLSADLVDREGWLKEYESHILELESLKKLIETKLKK